MKRIHNLSAVQEVHHCLWDPQKFVTVFLNQTTPVHTLSFWPSIIKIKAKHNLNNNVSASISSKSEKKFQKPEYKK